MISAPGYEQLITHLFVKGDEFLHSDAVFGVKDSLVLEFKRNDSSTAAEKAEITSPFYEVAYDFKLRKK